MSEQYPDWRAVVNRQLVDHEERIESIEEVLEQMNPAVAIDFDDWEYATPADRLRAVAEQYDLRTGPERAAAQLIDHQRRIAELEQRLRHMERLLHGVLNADEAAHGVP